MPSSLQLGVMSLNSGPAQPYITEKQYVWGMQIDAHQSWLILPYSAVVPMAGVAPVSVAAPQ
jgi:hypothetical protein